jgi:hypothetical protein
VTSSDASNRVTPVNSGFQFSPIEGISVSTSLTFRRCLRVTCPLKMLWSDHEINSDIKMLTGGILPYVDDDISSTIRRRGKHYEVLEHALIFGALTNSMFAVFYV